MSVYIKATALWADFRAGTWKMGLLRGSSAIIGDEQVVVARAAAVAEPSGGTAVDVEARAAVGQILPALQGYGLIQT